MEMNGKTKELRDSMVSFLDTILEEAYALDESSLEMGVGLPYTKDSQDKNTYRDVTLHMSILMKPCD